MAQKPEETQDLDEVDEADAAAVEQALAAIATQQMLAAGATPSLPFNWRNRLEADSSLLLKAYLVRIAIRMLRKAGADDFQAAEMADAAVAKVLPDVLDEAAKAAKHTYQVTQRLAKGTEDWGPGSRSGDPEDHTRSQNEAEAARRLKVGSEALSRVQATASRESTRFLLAQSMGATHKQWRTRRDPKVRPSHGGLEGDAVPILSSWLTLNGNHLRYPGDPLAPPEDVRNCRCRLSYRVPNVLDWKQAGRNLVDLGSPHRADVRYEEVGAQ